MVNDYVSEIMGFPLLCVVLATFELLGCAATSSKSRTEQRILMDLQWLEMLCRYSSLGNRPEAGDSVKIYEDMNYLTNSIQQSLRGGFVRSGFKLSREFRLKLGNRLVDTIEKLSVLKNKKKDVYFVKYRLTSLFRRFVLARK